MKRGGGGGGGGGEKEGAIRFSLSLHIPRWDDAERSRREWPKREGGGGGLSEGEVGFLDSLKVISTIVI